MEPVSTLIVPVLSTENLPASDLACLRDLAGGTELLVAAYPGGWFVYIGDPGDQAPYWRRAGLSEAFERLGRWVHARGWSFVRLDEEVGDLIDLVGTCGVEVPP